MRPFVCSDKFIIKKTKNIADIKVGDVKMATSSITKDFIIKDKEVYLNFKNELEKPMKKKKIKTSYLEEGKKALERFSFH